MNEDKILKIKVNICNDCIIQQIDTWNNSIRCKLLNRNFKLRFVKTDIDRVVQLLNEFDKFMDEDGKNFVKKISDSNNIEPSCLNKIN